MGRGEEAGQGRGSCPPLGSGVGGQFLETPFSHQGEACPSHLSSRENPRITCSSPEGLEQKEEDLCPSGSCTVWVGGGQASAVPVRGNRPHPVGPHRVSGGRQDTYVSGECWRSVLSRVKKAWKEL